MAKWDLALQQKIGPPWDAVCGDDGEDTDLNALVAAGKTKILLMTGAVLTANLTITATGGFFWSPHHFRAINLGAYTLTINGAYWQLAGFRIEGAVGAGIVLGANASGFSMTRVGGRSCGSHGLHINNAVNDHEIYVCNFTSNTGSGIRIESGAATARIENCMIWNNTLYGVDDQDDSSMLIGNRLNGNGSGPFNGTPAIDVGNLKV